MTDTSPRSDEERLGTDVFVTPSIDRQTPSPGLSFGVTRIAADEITLTRPIGYGAHSEVHLGLCRGLNVAVKVLRRRAADPGALEAEVELMSKLAHPNICLLLGACVERHSVALVMEYCPGGTLEQLLYGPEAPATIPISRQLRILHDIALGMTWLHGGNPPIIHRDLKPSNLLLTADGVVKICDFGLSMFLPSEPSPPSLSLSGGTHSTSLSVAPVPSPMSISSSALATTSSPLPSSSLSHSTTHLPPPSFSSSPSSNPPTNPPPHSPSSSPSSPSSSSPSSSTSSSSSNTSSSTSTSTSSTSSSSSSSSFVASAAPDMIRGTPLYLAPELLRSDGLICEKSDVYSFALICWELLARQRPFGERVALLADRHAFARLVIAGARPSLDALPPNAPQRLVRLLTRCWAGDAAVRPHFADILRKLRGVMLAIRLPDAAGRAFWTECFGGGAEEVRWEAFLRAFRAWGRFGQANEVEAACLRAVLVEMREGEGGEECVRMERFGRIAGWFWPLRLSSRVPTAVGERVTAALARRWFHGFVSKEEAEKRLQRSSIGSFLVRFSEHSPGCFTVSFLNGDDLIQHQRMYRSEDGGFHLALREGGGVQMCRSAPNATLVEFVEGIVMPRLSLDTPCHGWPYELIFSDLRKRTVEKQGYLHDAGEE